MWKSTSKTESLLCEMKVFSNCKEASTLGKTKGLYSQKGFSKDQRKIQLKYIVVYTTLKVTLP